MQLQAGWADVPSGIPGSALIPYKNMRCGRSSQAAMHEDRRLLVAPAAANIIRSSLAGKEEGGGTVLVQTRSPE